MAQGMNKLNEALASLPEVRELLLSLDAGTSPIAVSGLSGVHRAQLAAAVRHKTQRPLLIVCADENEANRMAGDLHELLGEDVSLLFAREWQLRDRVFASHGWEQQRIGSLCSLAAEKAPILLATVDGLMQRTLPPDALRGAVTDISLGDRFDLNALSKKLVESGYTRAETVEGVGQFALRGGILDVWSPLSAPVRVEFFDDEVDAMGEFDVTTQRRTQNVKSLTVLPAAEVLPALSDGGREKMLERLGRAAQKIAKKAEDSPIVQTLRSDIERLRNDLPLGGMDRYLAACYPDEVCALDYLSPDTLIAVSDGMRVLERSKNYHWELSEDVKPLIEEGVLCGEFAALALSQEALSHRMGAFPALLLDSLPTSRNLLPPRAILSMNARSLPSYGGSLETAAGDMERYLGAGCGVLVLCGNETRAKNFRRLLEERNIRAQLNLKNDRLPAPHETVIGLGALSAGSEYPQLKLVILTEGQLTAPLSGKRAKARPKKETSARAALRSYEDLSPGDLVVHVHHGIGRFAGIERMRVDGVDKDYIKICYAGNDSLYVPATQLDMVSKYIGGHGEDEDGQIRTKLSKLGGTDWSRAKTKARAAAKDLAKGLIALYAERQRRPGFAFSPDSPWQKEFEEAFDYEETDDQLRAIAEIKSGYEEIVNTVVASTKVELTVNDPVSGERMVRRQETNLGDLCADAYRAMSGADIAVVNGGGIRVSIPAGDITYGQIIAVHPFGNEMCVVEATGQQILDALEMGARNAPGECGGFLQVSGMSYEIDLNVEPTVEVDADGMFTGVSGEYRVKNVKVGDEPLDLAKTYTLASHNYMLKSAGDGMAMFQGCTLLQDSVMIDNQVLINYIVDVLGGVVGEDYADPYGQGRITVIEKK